MDNERNTPKKGKKGVHPCFFTRGKEKPEGKEEKKDALVRMQETQQDAEFWKDEEFMLYSFKVGGAARESGDRLGLFWGFGGLGMVLFELMRFVRTVWGGAGGEERMKNGYAVSGAVGQRVMVMACEVLGCGTSECSVHELIMHRIRPWWRGRQRRVGWSYLGFGFLECWAWAVRESAWFVLSFGCPCPVEFGN